MTSQIYNFSAGPCVLPKEVLQTAQNELLNWHGSGMSVMEMSHRGKHFVSIAEQTKKDITALLNIPAGYKIFFLQGGATSIFTMLPFNLLKDKKSANYLTTGSWSKQAKTEAAKFCKVNEVWAESKKGVFQRVPTADEWTVDPEGAYFHFCHNETIHGVECTDDFPFHKIPQGMPVVCDMSSNICSRPIDWSRYDMVYAGAQKNMGPSGVTLVVVKESLIGHAKKTTPILYDFQTHLKASSTFHNTPNCWGIYVAGLNYAFMLKEGMANIHQRTLAKSKILYDYIENSEGYFSNPVQAKYRSNMNVPFRVAMDKNLEAKFKKEAEKAGLMELGGHRSVGGCRASIYNGMPNEGVEALVAFMKKFKAANPVKESPRL